MKPENRQKDVNLYHICGEIGKFLAVAFGHLRNSPEAN